MIFIRKTPTQFEPRWVTAGNRVRDLVEITHGLADGEPVVTVGAFHLKSVLIGKDLGEE
jgi:cobalt-zinc-cadmium efflux system membrane fusion protein